jgi:diguanylate cyclase (GGDEF)-like protein
MAVDKPDTATAEKPTPSTAILLSEIERLRAALVKAEWRIAELEARADIDPLLDILNRRGFERELRRALSYMKRYEIATALVFLDLDGFKAVNDAHGHAAGDALLKAVVAQVKHHVRASDIVARLGGDEFAVILWHVDSERARAKALEIESVIRATEVMRGAARITVGASAGSVALAGDASPESMFEAADRAMYARKKEKRG